MGHPLALQARNLVETADLKGLDTFYKMHTGDEATIIVEGVCKQNNYSDLLENWGMEASKSATAQLFCGVNYSWRAWEARGGRLASEVSGGQFSVFHTWLLEAEKHLLRSIELDPANPAPYFRMLRVLLGLNGHCPQALNYLKKVQERQADHLLAHMSFLTQTCKKWGGTHEQMFQFARQTSQNAAEGSKLHTVIAQAIIERSVYYMMENDHAGANTFLQSDDTRNELYAAYEKSAGSDKMDESPLNPVVYNWFACNLIYSQLKAGRGALAAVGDKLTSRPWVYISAPLYGHVNELRSDFDMDPI